MTKLGLYIAATWTILCTCAAMPDLHQQMSSAQLRQIFHVDEPDLVPNYEIIKLNHHTTLHNVKKRSIGDTNNSLNSNLKNNILVNNNLNNNNKNKNLNHHVKKDLSKTPFDEKVSLKLVVKQIQISNSDSASTSSCNSSSSGDSEQTNQPEEITITQISKNKLDFSDIKLSDIKEHNVSFKAFGELLNLNLRPTEGLFKNGPQNLRMWNVRSDPNATQGLIYEEIEEKLEHGEHIGDIFQDKAQMAAILMRKQLENGDLLMEGSIGHEYVLRPVPLDLSQTESGGVHHIIYKRESNQVDDSDYAYMEPDRLQKRYRQKRSAGRSKRAVPSIIYPEILVIVDYDGYRLHGGDNVQVKRYFVSFWNGVDLRYRLLKGPRIRISIAGIIISRGRDATPYLERNRVGRDAIDSAAALTDMGKYLFRERRLPVYDIAVAITKLDMCRRQYANDACNRGTAGFAYVGGACVVNKRLEKVNSVAIIEDTGGFSGIIVAAHEVGHLLGAVHDGSPPPSYLGGPGAEKCRWEDGYIMSDLRHTERGFRWSPCSVSSFHHFLNGDTASCLHNPPHEDEALGRSLPGTLLTLDAQCQRDRGTSACFKDERVCAQLFCFDAQSGYCVAYRPAAEGSTCGDGQHCLDGRCVTENENIIPDYSQHTPSYASPNSFNSPIKTGGLFDEVDDVVATTTARTTTTRYTTTPRTTEPPTTSYLEYTTKGSVGFYNNNNNNYPTTSTKTTYKYNNNAPTTKWAGFFSTPKANLTATQAPRATTKSYYNGWDKRTEKTTKAPSAFNKYSFSTTKSPFDFSNFHQTYNKNNNNNYADKAVGATVASTTRLSVFDVYLKRKAASTRNPYDFGNLQYFKSTTKNPKWAYNYFGANSDSQNVTVAE